MEYIKRACHFQIEDETKWVEIKSVMTKSFLYEIIEPKVYTTTSSLSEIHI